MSSKTVLTTARQQPPAAVAAKSRRRFWANLVVQVSGLLAMLVVAVYSASAQEMVVPEACSKAGRNIVEAYIENEDGVRVDTAGRR